MLGCAVAAGWAGSASAADPDVATLAALVQKQSAEIDDLKKRLAAVEARQSTAPPNRSPTVAAAVASPPVSRPADAGAVPILARWSNGAAPTFTTSDGSFTFHPRGRILLDVSETSGSRYPERNYATTGARTLRLGADGTVGHAFDYVFEADFSQNAVNVLNAYVGWRSPQQRATRFEVRAGNVFLDRGVDASTGPDNVPFLDRNTVGTTIAPQAGFYGLGLMALASGTNWHVSVAATGDDIDGKTAVRDTWLQMARAHWDPLHEERAFVHLGAWGFTENFSPAVVDAAHSSQIGGRFDTMLRIQSGPILDASGSGGYGGELGGGLGSLWVMGEAGQRVFHIRGARDAVASAWSVSGGYFLTGEAPEYGSRFGTFGHPKVRQSVFDGGPGAIELTARYETLDYAHLVSGGRGWAATLGVNWYLNPFIRLMANYIHWDTLDRVAPFTGTDTGDTVSARAQITF
jgi:phosphate-selective porin OprO and OprP